MSSRLIHLPILLTAACTSTRPSPQPVTQPSPTPPADSSCVAALDSLRSLFQRDYPGYRDKVRGHEPALSALTDSVRAIARASDDYKVCIPALRRWALFFRDGHVTGPWQSAPPAPAGVAGGTPAEPPGPPADDPDRPSLHVLDDSTVSVRLPSFHSNYKPVIDSLFGANSTRLRATRYLIVDVRGNGGGYTGSYDSLTPLLYTDPVHFNGVDVWASPANIAHYRTMLSSNFLSAPDRALIVTFLTRAERRGSEFVQLTPDHVMRRDAVFPMPRRVAVLVDSNCASSCEDFVLEARQSRKVTLMGTHTAGIHDYGEVHSVWLPGWRRVALPASRVRDLRIDNVGIIPAIPIPESEADAVTFAWRYLYSVRRN